jgi:glutamine amidotransferase
VGDTGVVIVRTGTANLASVVAALRRLGADPQLTAEPGEVENAAAVVLPGVGSFGAAMQSLQADGMAAALRARIEAGRPTLCVCLGLQLLCAESEESPGVRGLGVIATRVRRFERTLRVPQFGWNHVQAQAGGTMVRSGYAYFANSYCLREPPDGWQAATAEYGGPFVAALEHGAVLACQFHPELSGAWGAELLGRWLTLRVEGARC